MKKPFTSVLLGLVVLGIFLCLLSLWYPLWQYYQANKREGILMALLLPHNATNGTADPLKQPLLWVMLLLMGIGYVTLSFHLRANKSDKHGSAHFATRSEARPFRHGSPSLPQSGQRLPNSQISPSHLILGSYHGKPISLTETQQASNVLVTAPVGAGKSSRLIIPNLLYEQGSRSLFISDVKGELVRKTAGAIAQEHDVWIFSPMQPQQSAGYNPLACIRTVEEAQEFARCWVTNTGKSKEDFWPNAAMKLMTAALLHIRVAEPKAAFCRIADILCGLSYGDLKQTLLTSPSRQARSEVKAFFEYLDMNPKLLGSVMADLGTRFQLLTSDAIRQVTAHHQINFRAMGEQKKRPIALYLSIPARFADRYQPLLACFMMQMFAEWEALAEETPEGQLPRPIMGYLEEFANLGYIPNINSYISTARHTGVGLFLVIQGFHQLDEKYGLAIRKNILTNTVTHLLLPGAGKEETEYYSERLGMSTIPTETHNARGTYTNAQESWTQGETGRKLMMPDELRTMSANQMLMLHGAIAPLLLETTPYFEDRRLAPRAALPFHSQHAVLHTPPSSQQPQTAQNAPVVPSQTPVVDTHQTNPQRKKNNKKYFLQE